MPNHWTYTEILPDCEDLIQGDILEPSKQLQAIFEEVHPHFLDPKYTGFLVTTQSCDMVRRKRGVCSTHYLNIAVVRQLDDVLHDFLAHTCKQIAPQAYTQESKGAANQLLGRIFNQNEQALGLFYLHEDADVGIAVPSVALLRVGVSLRVEHYECLVQARCGRLSSEFTAKLGWLVGNLYSRVGTPDWSEAQNGSEELKALIHDTLDTEASTVAPLWFQESWVEAARNNGVDLAGLAPKELEEAIEKHKPATARERVVARTTEVFKEMFAEVPEEEIEKFGNRLKNDGRLSNILKAK